MSSVPVFSSNQIDILAAVSDAVVKISSAQGTAQLIFNPTTGYYELKTNSYPIVPGQVYEMTVTTINGDVATAETQVPFTSVPISKASVQTTSANYQETDRITVSFTDEPGQVNYYRIAGLYAIVYNSQADTIIDDAHINKVYSDLNHDGEEVSLTESSDQANSSIAYYDVFLYNCSESYYNFYKSFKNYSGVGISFPPPGEPTLMYTNVNGGFGCFGAYTRSVLRYNKK